MSSRSIALYDAVYTDVLPYIRTGPVGPKDIYPGQRYKEFAASYLLKEVVRKWIPSDSSKADAASLESFEASNKRCFDWELRLGSYADEQLWGEFLRVVDQYCHPNGVPFISSYMDILCKGRTGPGSAVGAEGFSLYEKLFASKLTATSEHLYLAYKEYLNWFPRFPEAEEFRLEKHGNCKVVHGSRSSFVPKTSTTSRMICVEPSLNMFFQLGIGAHIEDLMSTSWNLKMATRPDVNRRLSYVGSRDDSYATIDLHSASDSISLRMCEAVLPKWLFELLLHTRSHTTQIAGKKVGLYMMSTMGNGFTFPLQTFMFGCMIIAVYRTLGLDVLCYGDDINWSVFGDDLIVDKKAYRRLVRLLELAGFIVNSDKTFFEGPFRESCGTDWLYGQPVRPVYLKKLSSKQDIFVAINLLNEWSAYTGIGLHNTIMLLVSWLRPEFRTQLVPFEENSDAGIRVPLHCLHRKVLNRKLFALEYKADKAIPLSIRVEDGQFRWPRSLRRKSIFNPQGLYCSFLHGELVNCTISVRHYRVKYRTKRAYSSRWDYIPPNRLTNGVKLSWQQWETAVSINLDKP